MSATPSSFSLFPPPSCPYTVTFSDDEEEGKVEGKEEYKVEIEEIIEEEEEGPELNATLPVPVNEGQQGHEDVNEGEKKESEQKETVITVKSESDIVTVSSSQSLPPVAPATFTFTPSRPSRSPQPSSSRQTYNDIDVDSDSDDYVEILGAPTSSSSLQCDFCLRSLPPGYKRVDWIFSCQHGLCRYCADGNLDGTNMECIVCGSGFRGEVEDKPSTSKSTPSSSSSKKVPSLPPPSSEIIFTQTEFSCPICLCDIPVGDGILLNQCLHAYCTDCIRGIVQNTNSAQVKCPSVSDSASSNGKGTLCNSPLTDSELRALATTKEYEAFLHRSLVEAEMANPNSFHCRRTNCEAWLEVEDGVKGKFPCPSCKSINCLDCEAVHEGVDCSEYKERLQQSDWDVKTKKLMQAKIRKGLVRRCPTCRVIIEKNGGCDHMYCTVCNKNFAWTRALKPTVTMEQKDGEENDDDEEDDEGPAHSLRRRPRQPRARKVTVQRITNRGAKRNSSISNSTIQNLQSDLIAAQAQAQLRYLKRKRRSDPTPATETAVGNADPHNVLPFQQLMANSSSTIANATIYSYPGLRSIGSNRNVDPSSTYSSASVSAPFHGYSQNPMFTQNNNNYFTFTPPPGVMGGTTAATTTSNHMNGSQSTNLPYPAPPPSYPHGASTVQSDPYNSSQGRSGSDTPY